MNELKPCPFCGGEAYFNLGTSSVKCCVCGVLGSAKPTEESAAEAWNQRAEKTCKPELQDPMFGEREYWCSECSCKIDIDDNFCWNCGAKVTQ